MSQTGWAISLRHANKQLASEDTDLIVDARGHRCPVPTLRLWRALEAAPPGQIVRLYADDPLALIDVPHFVIQVGAELLRKGDHEGAMSFRVRKRS